MENPNQNTNPPTMVPPAPNVDQLAIDRQKFGENFQKLKETLKVTLKRFLSNKKMVILVGGITGLILLIIIAMLFSNRLQKRPFWG